jgi:hypothetical protein
MLVLRHTVAAVLAATLLSVAPPPTPAPLAQEPRPALNPGSLQDYYTIVVPPRVEMVEFVDPLGHVSRHRAYTFVIEARRSFLVAPLFLAHFYDRDGVAITASPLDITPTQVYVQPGTRARANFLLPPAEQWSRTHRIEIREGYGR